MPTVPYSPVPSVPAQAAPLRELRPSIPIEAFGSDIAQAIGSAGKTLSGVGDAIFERALWLQNQNNAAEARNAEASYIEAAGKLHAEYNSLEGEQAIKAYPGYAKQLKVLRESIRGGLSTGDAQRRFDDQSLGTLSRSIFNASSHLASQQKAYITSSMEAKREALRTQAAQNPNDDIGFKRAESETAQTIDEEGRLRGMPPEAIDNAKLKATSRLWAGRIENQAKEFPLSGSTLLENSRHRLTPEDYKRVETIVNNQRDAYGSAKIATDLVAAHTDADGDLTVPMAELQAKARGLAEQFSPDDPAFVTKTVRALDAEFNQRKYAKKQENYDNRDILNAAILGGASNMDDIMNNPKARAAYFALPERDRLKIPGQIDNYIKARDRAFNERTMTTIMGLKNNDVENFLTVDPTDDKYRLSQSQIRQVQAEQAKIKNQSGGDPRVDRAMRWMRAGFGAQMEALGVYSRTQRNKEDYDHLTGAVQQALDIWQEDHKKPPSNKEFNEQIAPQVLKTTREPGMFGLYGYGVFGTDRPFFQHDTSSREYRAFYERAKAEVKERSGAEPTDAEVYKAFTRLQLLKLYPPKGASTDARP